MAAVPDQDPLLPWTGSPGEDPEHESDEEEQEPARVVGGDKDDGDEPWRGDDSDDE